MTPAATLQSVQVSLIAPWLGQPRSRQARSAEKDAELLDSVKQHGVLQSLVLRPKPDGDGYLIVCGERRWTAAKAAGLELVPATVRELTEAEALKIALIENIQRHDMHPLDEAEAVQRLQKLDRAVATPAALAAQLGVPESHVRRRLRYLRLGKAAAAAFRADAITAQHADELAKIHGAQSETVQQQALVEACFHSLARHDVDKAVKKGDWASVAASVAPVAELRSWMAHHLVANVKDEAVQDAIPGLREVIEKAEQSGVPMVQLSRTNWGRIPEGLLQVGKDWCEVGKYSSKCENAEVNGLVVHGGRTEVVTFCRTKGCPAHFPAPAPRPGTAAAKAARANETIAEKRLREAAERQRKQEAEFQRLRKDAWPAVIAAVKAKARLSADVVRGVLSNFEIRTITDRTGLKFSDETALAFLALHPIVRAAHARQMFAGATKRYGFDLAKFERDRARQLKAKSKAEKDFDRAIPKTSGQKAASPAKGRKSNARKG
jgi:ParB/RepB/Spo0J family partition protein